MTRIELENRIKAIRDYTSKPVSNEQIAYRDLKNILLRGRLLPQKKYKPTGE